NYLNGNYRNYSPDTRIEYVPNYRLPTLEERQQILIYSDSVNKRQFERCKTKSCKRCKDVYYQIYADIIPCKNDTSYNEEPTRNVYSGCISRRGLYNLRGNVCEWTTENGICVGGGWKNSKEKILSEDIFKYSE